MDLSIRTGADKGKKVTVGTREVVIGRDPATDLTLEDDEVSRSTPRSGSSQTARSSSRTSARATAPSSTAP
jgi:hypothetical protein